MLEYIIYKTKHPTPLLYFLNGLFFTVISASVSLILFPTSPSVAHVLLSTVATAPLIFRGIVKAAKILSFHPHLVISVQWWLLKIYLAFLGGTTMGYFSSYLIFGEELYTLQKHELDLIRGKFTGGEDILSNNLTVYLIGVFLSFLYGTGGALLINWNSSIIGYMLYLEAMSGDPLGLLISILPHGILEFAGYFMGGITGVMLGVAIIQRGWSSILLRDTLIIFVTGILFIVLGAIFEIVILSASL